MRTAKTLIRLGGWPGWSESALGAKVILLVLSRGGSIIKPQSLSRKSFILDWLHVFAPIHMCRYNLIICTEGCPSIYSNELSKPQKTKVLKRLRGCANDLHLSCSYMAYISSVMKWPNDPGTHMHIRRKLNCHYDLITWQWKSINNSG